LFTAVPNLNVTLTALSTQTVGKPLALQCSYITVRGFTSTVRIEWRHGNRLVKDTGTIPITIYDSLVYDFYTTSQLSTTDDGRVIQCKVIYRKLSIIAGDSITLDVAGMYVILLTVLYDNIFALHTVPPFTVTTSPSGPIQGATVGSPQVINCTVSTVSGVESSSVMISWMEPGGGSITTNSRMTISSTTSSGSTYTNSLQFTYLMEGDEGTYTCNVTILGTNGSQSVEIESLTSKL